RQDATGPIVDLAAVRVPTLVICGTEDKVNPPELSRTIAAGIAGARMVWIEGAGHLCNIENPREFNAALDDFLPR
ncbi:MAG TPA: alpha/beta fold hydrolase, partial [Burkholderiales bacterium]|nr:alpha/beta fold hydrolase [Burkholderiales bacterium]